MPLQAEIAATPLWQDNGIVLPAANASSNGSAQALPAQTDVLIVGAGYTGLAAAHETASAGLATLVLDAGRLGAGCSGRNGGQVAYSFKPSFAELGARHGEARAFAICREAFEAMAHLRALATQPGADCDWRECGCFYGAHTRRHFERMARDARNQPRGLEQRISVVPRSEQWREIASDFYHGGCLYPDDASVDPMKLLLLLWRRARERGARVQDCCRVESIGRSDAGFEVTTSAGVVTSAKVLIATNGYSGPLSPWHRRRVIPIGSYQISTEPLGKQTLRSLIPEGRNIVDSRRVVVYLRPSTDGERLVFGGRAALAETDPLACVPRLKAMMGDIFPQLRSVRIDHAWVGWVAYTFDKMPHLGLHEGIHYCMGYCGQGVPLAPYFGMKIGQQMAGLAQGRTALDGLPFPARPYYHRKPWFLAPSVFAYRTLDALGI
jgi:glycine/D-amino acid oxidase-like deaminating enzyme